ncbi:hypothetical protein SEA_SPILLED_113 [Streptomyces phage Spilled]|jgi:hypothetical protein|uniref:Uncharacterized protein n=4 Tax=Streptomyces virus Karimac TaxID=2846401 RepID=A0A5Q2WKR2_9CAUD|nr:hypothetical protein [Streptomyces sp. JV178]YP_009840278.1 hypothetical protein HWB80_gp174 [Streptomyces phage Karimac]QDF17276.1 hypothetical protein SEA_BIRCHLYN_109 [Streptomyces phage Birchlyn]QFP97420.1 hypothetical protein SEA_ICHABODCRANE_109 [Streptomyces phage IchabodCrane]QGH74350.1 hypothetical protein SEA_WIPEOUT_109 [Streptomyces phage Wipeout]QGH79875.1 hypothetical protein SEA_BORDEAUX_110 [Streptomyces phage Bordeaux]QPL13744.1 hypothetical protein SEA_MINDFLAYER_109 [Str
MELLMVGPVFLWVLVTLYLVKKKGRQWPDLFWGILGGLIVAKLFPETPNTIFNLFSGAWDGIVSIFQSVSG